ncbi:phosphatase PAP2 family protein [Rhodococcus sp. G-MC3]|uniref:phosphatase PAP2 family protein n=1 Tax=Rhodococcus sp. G-MC3 TaxID=3046209 RepID=UPI0024BA706C|nr:phosphatase PAP2 family protein [Rhodococcus sp. G-MC3]MDJ0394224.1 phosphatase PAP2 family protein [Rhodococcus sp. G-MC3]
MIHSSSLSTVHSTVTEVLTEAATADVELVTLATAVGLVVLGAVLRRRRDDRAGGTIVVAVGFALALAVLAVAVRSDGWLVGADDPITQWFVSHRNSTLNELAIAITTAGGPPETAAVGVLAAVALVWRTKRYGPAVIMLATVAAASILCTVLKFAVGRSRPPLPLQLMLETDYSFPSGHVTGTATLMMLLALVLGARRSTRVRVSMVVGALAVATLVAVTRLYLGVHWFTDVCGGALLAALMVTLGACALRLLDTRVVEQRNFSAPSTRKVTI